MVKLTHKTRIEAHTAKIMLGVMLMFMFSLTFVAALDFSVDNYKVFDEEVGDYGKITLWDKGQLGDDKILAEYEITSHTSYCIENCYTEGTIIVNSKNNLFNDLKFYNDNFDEKQINHQLFVWEEILVEEDILERDCSDDKDFKTCSMVPSGETEIIDRGGWIESEGDLDLGTYKWRIEGRKTAEENIDWIGESFGQVMDEWAVWGGVITSNATHTFHTYETAGDFWFNTTVELVGARALIVAGGGSGSSPDIGVGVGGGGAAGGMVYNLSMTIPIGNHRVYVGTGGIMGDDVTGVNGSNSYFNGLNMSGGGGGGYWHENGHDGGSGGGGGQATGLGGAGIAGQGNNGGNSGATSGGGGGGAGAVGSAGSGTTGGNGGSGATNDINGSIGTYSCGGGGGGVSAGGGGAGGCSLGGNGGHDALAPTGGKEGTGSGGGGSYETIGSGGNGGSGIIIIMYETPPVDTAEVKLNSPSDGTNFSSNPIVISANTTSSIDLRDVVLFIDGVRNKTYDGEGTQGMNISESLSFSEGTHTWFVTANNSLGTINISANRTFTLDLTAPVSNIEVPSGDVTDDFATTNDRVIAINWTVEDSGVGLQACWYYNQTANVTVTCGVNASITLPYGTYTHVVYANDSVNNIGQDSFTATYDYNAIENSIDYTQIVQQGVTDTFTLNVSGSGGAAVSATFYYDDVAFASSKLGDNNEMRFVNVETLNSPGNNLLWWAIDVGGTLYNSTIQQQNVSAFNLTSCGTGGTVVYNFTVFDEGDVTKLDGSGTNLTVEISLNVTSTQGVEIFSYNRTANNINPVTVCTDNPLSSNPLIVDGIVRYAGNTTYISEFYTIQNFSLTDTTTSNNVSLYLLQTDDAQEFKVSYRDNNFLPVPGAVLELQRQYIGDGLFRVVELPPFDDDGETLANFVLGDVIYTLIIKKDNQILSTFPNVKAFCENLGTGDCKIDLVELASTLTTEDFASVGGVTFTLSYDEDARVVTSVFNVNDGTNKLMSLNTTLFDMIGNTTICTDSLTASSGTLTCTVPSTFGNASATSILYADGTQLGRMNINLWLTSDDRYSGNQITLGLISLLTIIGIGLSGSGIMVIVFIIVGVIVNMALFIFNGGGFIGAGSVFLWLIIALATLLWKANRRTA